MTGQFSTGDFPFIDRNQVPWLSAAEMREVDVLAVDTYGLQLLQMMENAGRCLAAVAGTRFFNGDLFSKRIVVLAGQGGNGGGALAAARRLAIRGAHVTAVLSDPGNLSEAAAFQHQIIRRMGIPVLEGEPDREAIHIDLVIDGLVGYSLSGAPRGTIRRLIEWINQQQAPVLALDVPSGLDASSGEAPGMAIKAEATLTLALPKKGLFHPDASHLVGDCFLADIGIPSSVYQELGIRLPETLFSTGGIIKLLP
jgi:NAD(P)H-hydrate epimerase